MSAFYLMIPMSLLLATVFLIAFLRSVSGGQFDDLTSNGQRMLEDSSELMKSKTNNGNSHSK